MKKLNILLVCDAIIQQTGGSFISTLRFAELLHKKGHKVIILAAKYPKTKKIEYYNGIKVYRASPAFCVPKFEKRIAFAIPSSRTIKKIIKKEDINVVHVTLPTPLTLAAIKAAKSLSIKVVTHSHAQPENVFLHAPKFLQIKFINDLFYKYLIWIYKKGDIILCPSKFAESLIKRYDSNLKTKVISNGVDLTKFKKINFLKFIEKYKLSKKDKRIIFVGRLHPEKSVETLIKSVPYIIEKYNNFHVDIVGGGYMYDELKNLIKELKVEKYVTLFGRVSDEDLIMALNASDIFVLPSMAELEGMVVLEAMACGKPIVIANSPESASRFFVEDNGFLFKPKDYKDLADKLLKLLLDEKLLKKMSDASLRIIKKYDINKSVCDLEKIYSS
ncbi:MAG TPA: glycosyltransferase [Candidatus Paceibacterota bacterium]|nr:glycosyltransferase [Candidatus Paceibacterota bacterium]